MGGSRLQSSVRQAIAGGPTEEDTYVIKAHEQEGQVIVSIPFALSYDGPEPGVGDVPFYYSSILAADDTPQGRWRRQRNISLVLSGSSNEGLSIPLPILDAPPSEFPLIVGVSNDISSMLASSRRRRKMKLLSVNRSTLEAIGMFPENVPASSYLGDSCRLLSEIQRHMLEPTIDGGLTWSALWTADEVRGFLNDRLSRFLRQTSIIETDFTVSVVSGTSSYDLPSDLILIERVGFDDGSTTTALSRVDQFVLDNGFPGWETTTGTPYAYYEDDDLSIRLYPTPNSGGTLRIRYVANHPTVNSPCVRLSIPSIFVPTIKYGVMSDMFGKEGEANDPIRAKYCEDRYVEGVELALLLMGK